MAVTSTNKFPVLPTILAMNLFPLAGVLFFNWSFFAIIYIYWWETVIMSMFNLFKMHKASALAQPDPNMTINGLPQTFEQVNNVKFMRRNYTGVRVFTLFIYFVFICVFIGMYQGSQPGQPGPVEIVFFMEDFMRISLFVIFLYYLIDYLVFRMSGEWQETTVAELAVPFDGRSVVMHVVIVLGAVSTVFLGEKLFGSEEAAAPVMFTSFFVLVKTGVDVVAAKKKMHRETMVGEAIFNRKKQGQEGSSN
jgi:hypothetical protein